TVLPSSGGATAGRQYGACRRITNVRPAAARPGGAGMSFDTERLYELLPAFYRVRDAEQGEPLKALLSVIAEQVAVLEEDLAQLYDDQFIETCAEWVVPYIGDLVGTRSLFVLPNVKKLSQRAQ